jgi:uncharacterized protein YjbI with pentapeptide repeats
MLNLFFYKNSCDISQAQIYSVYEEFVKSTIRGKFRGISPAIKELSSDYEKYLIDIASLINTRNQIQSSETNYDEWQLDSNITSYVVKLKDLKPEIIKLATKLEENISNNLDQSRLFGNVLSCYFFEVLDDKCRFKDNNILFFFLAKKWLILLENICNEYDCNINENTEIAYQNLTSGGISHVNPTIFDFILRKINSNNNLKPNLINFVEQILDKKLLFIFRNNQFSDFDSNLKTRITVDFLLLILFINLNRNSYHDFPDFFDWLNWYVKVCSSFIADCENTLKTMFRRICLYNLTISRFNLNGYNFDHAKISDTRFYQVNLIGTRMNHVEFNEVDFDLCFIDDLSINESYGSVKFSDCRIIDINGCPFSATGIKKRLFMKFENCYIKKITITANNNGDGNSSRVNFEFRSCNIEEIIFRGSKSNEINFLDTKYNHLDINQSEVSLIKLENTNFPDNIYTGNPSFDPKIINR